MDSNQQRKREMNKNFIKSFISCAFVGAVLVFSPSQASAAWEKLTTNEMNAADSQRVFVDPSNSQKMYLHFKNGSGLGKIYRTTTAGASWIPVSEVQNGLPANTVYFSMNPGNPAVLFAGVSDTAAYGGCYRSEDSGQSWKRLTSTNGLVVYSGGYHDLCKSVVSVGYNTLLLVSSNNNFYKSTNAGKNWTKFTPKGEIFTNIVSMVSSPPNRKVVYNTSGGNLIYKSVDAGLTWKRLTTYPAGGSIQEIHAHPGNAKIVYVADSNLGVLVSKDEGTSWTPLTTGLVKTDGARYYISSVAVDRVNAQIMYAGANQYLYKSVNGGASWTPILSNTLVRTVSVDPVTHTTVYVGGGLPAQYGQISGLYRSKNSGL